MEKIRLCIGSNDGVTVAGTHMGDTEFFHIYDIFEDSKSEFIEKRANSTIGMDHAAPDKIKAVLKIVHDAEVLVAKKNSPNFVKIAGKTSYQPIVVSAGAMPEVLEIIHGSFDLIGGLVARRKNGEIFGDIPELG
ncbi:MAG: hypothetical protein KAV42_02535 [Candidatus Krumholzibacteria bacterium]|nr:hypothetical protein [Candidatus Krumholzibacteria bacterium]